MHGDGRAGNLTEWRLTDADAGHGAHFDAPQFDLIAGWIDAGALDD